MTQLISGQTLFICLYSMFWSKWSSAYSQNALKKYIYIIFLTHLIFLSLRELEPQSLYNFYRYIAVEGLRCQLVNLEQVLLLSYLS